MTALGDELRARKTYAPAVTLKGEPADVGALLADKVAELYPNFASGASSAGIAAWDALYKPMASFDVKTRIDRWQSPDSTTFLDAGTFCDVHVDLLRPETHVVSVARFWIDASTESGSEDAATFEHYANTIDVAVRIRQASLPDREPRWAAVPEAFTVHVDEANRIWFVFYSVRHTPLRDHPAFRNPQRHAGELRRLMWHLVVSAWFLENVIGLAHRDVKPANVLVTAHGAVFCDFGSSRMLGCAGNPSFYMNPPWMDMCELEAVIQAIPHVWAPESSTFAVGMIMLRAVWGKSKFDRTFAQHEQKRWPHRVAAARDYYARREYRKHFTEAVERPGWLHQKMTSDAAAGLLQGKPNGTFLVRKHSSSTYTLSVVHKSRPTHHNLVISPDVSEVNESDVWGVADIAGMVKHLRTKRPYCPVPLADHVAFGGRGLEVAALLLSNPLKEERCTLAYMERVLRPTNIPELIMVHLPPALQRSEDELPTVPSAGAKRAAVDDIAGPPAKKHPENQAAAPAPVQPAIGLGLRRRFPEKEN